MFHRYNHAPSGAQGRCHEEPGALCGQLGYVVPSLKTVDSLGFSHSPHHIIVFIYRLLRKLIRPVSFRTAVTDLFQMAGKFSQNFGLDRAQRQPLHRASALLGRQGKQQPEGVSIAVLRVGRIVAFPHHIFHQESANSGPHQIIHGNLPRHNGRNARWLAGEGLASSSDTSGCRRDRRAPNRRRD